MFAIVKKDQRPPRKKDYFLPDGTVPRPRSRWSIVRHYKETYVYRFRYDRLTLEYLAELAGKGELVYVPRVYYKVELRQQGSRINGKNATPKTIKTWFIKESDLSGSALRKFWKAVSDDLAGFGLSRSEMTRIKAKIAEVIPK